MAFVFVDRQSNNPGRYKVVPVNGGSAFYADLIRADEPIVEGTPLNADTFNQIIAEGTQGVVERNNYTTLKFWYGTQAEYDAITNKDDNTVYVISDDNTIEQILNGNLPVGWAGKATCDALGNAILSTYGNFSGSWYVGVSGSLTLSQAGTYQFKVNKNDLDGDSKATVIMTWDGSTKIKSVVSVMCSAAGISVQNLAISSTGKVYLESLTEETTTIPTQDTSTAIMYRRVC